MPHHKSRKRKLPAKSTTAAIISTLGVASVGTWLSFNYATEIANFCLSSISDQLTGAVENLAEQEISIQSKRFLINATINLDIQSILTADDSIVLTIPIDTPSLSLRVLDLIGSSAVETLNGVAETIAKAISEKICYNEVLAHGLAVTLTLTGLLALLAYTCHANQNLKDDMTQLREKYSELEEQLAIITQALKERDMIPSRDTAGSNTSSLLPV